MTSNRRIAVGAVLALGCSGLALAAGAADPILPKLTAEQIVEKNVAARGGLTAWRAVKAISYSGSLDAGRVRPDNGLNPASTERLIDKPGKPTRVAQAPDQNTSAADAGTPVSLPYTLTMERPNKQRVEVKFNDQLLVQVYDGQQGWKLQPYLHRGALPFTREELKKAEQFQQIDGPLIDCTAKGTTVALEGTDTVDGRPAYRLKLLLKSGDTRRVWVDGETFLDVQVDGSRRLNGHTVGQFTALRDFRSVDGIKVPYLMETRTEGLPDRETIVVDKVALNPKVDERVFARPN
jgi:hypothetical protein